MSASVYRSHGEKRGSAMFPKQHNHRLSRSPCRSSREMQMKPPHHAAAPAWSPALESYDYLSSLIARDWAWEGLRRNQSYQAEARAHAATADITEHPEGRALVTRLQ